jgi:hypothetical protein
MLPCGNIVLLKIRFLDVAKFTTLTPLSLLISCILSFPIVGLASLSLTYFIHLLALTMGGMSWNFSLVFFKRFFLYFGTLVIDDTVGNTVNSL